MTTEPEVRLFDRSLIGLYRSDASGRLLRANDALAAMLDCGSAAEVLTLDLMRDVFVKSEDAPVLADAKDGDFVDGRLVQWKTRTGNVINVQLAGQIVDTAAGHVFDGTAIDLTETDALEKRTYTQRQEHKLTARILETVLHQMPALYWLTDRDLRIVQTAGAVEQIVGYPRDKYLGVRLADVLSNDPASGDSLGDHMRALAGETIVTDNVYRGKLMANVVAPYRDLAGDIIGVLGTSIDVTAYRALERRMVDAQRAESLGILAGGLAHDFNNLLVAVLGNADLALRETPVGHPGRAALENIRIAGLRAAELTDQLLAYAGQTGAGTTRVEPGLLVDELLRILAPAIPENVKFTVEIPLKLAVRGDPAQLRQVLLNLINNARDALLGRGGEVHVRAEAMHLDGSPHPDDIQIAPAGSYVMITVSDDGPGMDAETRRHVFEPFFTTKQTGHGLGLAAVLGIVRTHGGGIRVTSTPGRGARFQVLWPAAITAAISAVSPVVTAGSQTVLVIDDEDLVREVVARMVEELGYAAITAADGKSGLAMIEAQTVDAVLVDLTMPLMSGADVVAVLRERRPDLPLIVCSGYDRDGCGPVQADAFLPKPFRIDSLQRTLAKLLPLRSV